ncbi:MAG TPA: hypothetical protein VMF52_09130 [Steroidobacteraceae bacterium]|nr:hypothetical protein [Steroidobacteraceae bacterium]
MSLNEFADDVVNLLGQLTDDEVSASAGERCRESCAAVWTAMVAALDSSSLSGEERAAIQPMLLDVLLPFWKKHCADELDIPALLADRATHYLERRDPSSQIKTAANLVNGLMDRLGVAADTRPSLGTTLTAVFAHRMIGDVHRINDVRARFGIELPVVAALTAIVHVTMNYEPVLRILRLV